MCGIIGYAGNGNAIELLYSGLEKLEYRGYDSCGAAVTSDYHSYEGGDNAILYWHHLGAPSEVTDIPEEWGASCGIAHTRWATHGEVTVANAHPHYSYIKDVFVVHNGVIENYQELKEELKGLGYSFYSDTDTEVLANLISFYLRGDPDNYVDVLRASLKRVEGTYGLAVIFKKDPHAVYAARRSSPLVIGVGENENYLASDTNALPHHIDKVIYLEDENIAKVTKGEFSVYELRGRGKIDADIYPCDKSEELQALGKYDSFLHKEICEQPESILDSFRGRFSKDFSSVVLGGISLDADVKRVLFLGCGTAYHAGLLGKYYMENVAGTPASVEISSEYKYKNNPTEDGTLVVAVSQSGETIDTLSAIKESQNKNLKTIAITNVVMSSIARQVEEGVYQRIGPEVSVASTKAFTSQATILFMLSVLIGEKNNLSVLDASNYIQGLRGLPNLARLTIDLSFERCKELAERYSSFNNINFLGRQYQYPVALEGALKLKELAYLNTCAYPSGEMKHGPLASMDKDSLCFFVAPEENLFSKNITTMKELKSRGVKVILIKQIGLTFPKDCYDEHVDIANTKDYLLPALSVIPLQIFSMYMAKERGYNVDRPRHLAKSVTVE